MHVRLIDVPMDLGAGRRGVDMGPSALRLAGIKEKIVAMGFSVEDDQDDIFVPIPEHGHVENNKLKFLKEIITTCEHLAHRVELAKEGGFFPIVMGGDHSIAIGTIAGLSSYYKKQGKKLGVVWVDAHADMNTPETSPTGNIHGMPLAVNIGLGAPELVNLYGNFQKLDPKNVALIGIRDLDRDEKKNVKARGINAYTMADIDRLGIYAVIQEAITILKERVDVIHISFDVDGMDPGVAPGVGTPVPGGLRFRETHLIMETLAETGLVGSMEITEINPILDIRNQTAETAVEMVCSALGKTIL
ncbi:MAG: arginase [Bacteroidetes bacterium]|nr:arginase [Bacteroidota bacterium]